ncbi:RNA polymerase factor sigma-32 [Caenispirillum salinarum]|uniref:RNA polymerase factor sigma-32 n=1 Tax=Caenispirillum salinarum TaxID=859058 RepID=UPI00384F23D2
MTLPSSDRPLPPLRLPDPRDDRTGGLRAYLSAIHALPVLTEDEERRFADAWAREGDIDAAHRLVTAHLRLVPKVARQFRGQGMPLSDLIGEGNIGLLQSLKRYDPDKGFRFATYARWWIRAAILNHLLQDWSLVKIGTGTGNKRLFFNLAKAKREMGLIGTENMTDADISRLAERLDVSPSDIVRMSQRLSGGDLSLDHPTGSDPDDGRTGTLMDTLADERPDQEAQLADRQESHWRREKVREAFGVLDERERTILARRYLTGRPHTLQALAALYGVTAERIRQIEAKAINKMRQAITAAKAAKAAKASKGAAGPARRRARPGAPVPAAT